MKRDIPIKNSVERQKIVENLKAEIASGAFKPGQRLVEIHLSNILGVTRGKIREALRQLEQDGFVEIIPNVGARVAEFSQKDIEHIYDLMSVLEGLAVRVITPFLTNLQLKRIEALVDKVEAVHKPTQFFELNNELHSFLIALTENDHLIKIADNFMFKIRCLNLQCLFSPGQMAAGVREHRKILEAIKARNAVRAEQLMRNHLFSAKNRLIKFINKSL
ncbi:MAG TPA: GntR family transcriptional regulator [Thermodesulfobacteriota bacterium]|nr:GntR family transcriptional regulator [Thermodesulfobacteriota bacterium]